MTAKRDEPDGQQLTPKPSLTGDRRLDKALEKLRRTLEAKKEAIKQSSPASGRAEHSQQGKMRFALSWADAAIQDRLSKPKKSGTRVKYTAPEEGRVG